MVGQTFKPASGVSTFSEAKFAGQATLVGRAFILPMKDELRSPRADSFGAQVGNLPHRRLGCNTNLPNKANPQNLRRILLCLL